MMDPLSTLSPYLCQDYGEKKGVGTGETWEPGGGEKKTIEKKYENTKLVGGKRDSKQKQSGDLIMQHQAKGGNQVRRER